MASGSSIRATALLALAAMLSQGCASIVTEVAELQDTSILNPDTVQGERGSRRARAVGGGRRPNGADASSHLRGSDPDCLASAGGGASPPAWTFYCRQQKSAQVSDDKDKARIYLSAGITLSNELCDAWFTRLQVAQVTLRQTSDAISAVGTLTSAIQGFTNVSTETMGLTATIFGVAKQSNDQVAANYLVSADISAVAAAVKDYRALYAQEIDEANGVWNYYTARRVIMAYDNTCSAVAVKRFVNARVADEDEADTIDTLFDAAVASFAADWDKYFEKQTSVAQLVDIYAYLYTSNAEGPVREALARQLQDEGFVEGTAVRFKAPMNEVAFRNALVRANVESRLKSLAEARVSTVKSGLANAALVAEKEAEAARKRTEEADLALAAAAQDVGAAQRQLEHFQKAQQMADSRVAALAPAEQLDVAHADVAHALKARSLVEQATAALQVAKDRLRAAEEARARLQTAESAAKTGAEKARAIAGAAGLMNVAHSAPVPSAPDGRPLDAPPKP